MGGDCLIEDFIFDGVQLSDFGYIICSFDSSVGITTSPVSENTYEEIKSSNSNISHKVSQSYDSNLSRVIQICKNPCSNEMELSNDDVSEITKWLCRKDYKWFRWIDLEDDDEIYYEAKINIQKIELGNKIGFELNITTNRPYGLTRMFDTTFEFDSNSKKSINIYSDEEGYIYPDVIIELKESGNLEIINEFENRITSIKNCNVGEIITIIGNDTQQIVTSDNTHDLSESFIFNYNFLRLCNLYGNSTNMISVNLKCNITIKYRGIRKVGI